MVDALIKIRPLAAITLCALLIHGCGVENPAGPTPPIENAHAWTIEGPPALNDFFDCLDEANAALISAHRGGSYPGWPENTLETMLHVLKAAPAIMEIDVAATSDGVLYLMHDDTLDRTTTGVGSASATAWRDIARLKLRDENGAATDFSPPLFSDVLARLKDRTILQIDFKRSARFEDVIREVKRQGADRRVIYIAYSAAAARKLHRLHPEAMISLSIDSLSALNSAVAAGTPADRLLAFTGVKAPRPCLFEAVSARGVEIIFGTLGRGRSIDNAIEAAGDDARYSNLASAGVDIIATDRPLKAFAALERGDRAPRAGECGVSRHE